MNITKVKTTTLKAGLATDGDSISVQKMVDSNDDALALSDFGTFLVVVLKQGSKIEIIKCDGLTQNSDGSATLDVAPSGRNISPKSPYGGSSTGKAFSSAEVVVTNDPLTMSFFLQSDQTNTFSAVNTYTQFPEKSGGLTPTDDEQFATKAYVDATATGDAVTSSLKSSVTFGEAVSEGNPVYLKVSDGKWWRAYANNPATCIDVELGIAQGDYTADEAGVVTRKGRDVTQTGMTLGDRMYLTDAGAIGDTAGSYVVEFGIAASTTSLIVDIRDGDREQFISAVTGMIVPFGGSTTPSGFLACDGSLLNFTDYPDLLGIIGVKYGLGAGAAFTTTFGTDVVDLISHGFANGKQLILSSTGTLPGGLSEETVYYVVEQATNTFKLSLTEGGAAIDLTDDGTGTHSYHTQFKLPDLRGSVIIGKGQKSVAIDITSVTLGTSQGTVSSSDSTSDDEWVQFTALSGVSTGKTMVFPSGGPGGSVSNGVSYFVHKSGSLISFYNTRDAALAGNSSGAGLDIGSTTGGQAFSGGSINIPVTSGLITGTKVTLSTDGTLPSGLEAGDYFLIKDSDTVYRLAETAADAAAGIGHSIGTAGSGTHTITYQLTNRSMGEFGGDEEHILLENEMPSHTHGILDNTDNSGTGTFEGGGRNDDNVSNDDIIKSAGGDDPHNNMQPYVVANWIIKT